MYSNPIQTTVITNKLFNSALLLCSVTSVMADSEVLTSPSGNLKVTVTGGERLTYEVTEGDTQILAPSPLGVTVDGKDLGTQAEVGEPTTRKVTGTYPILGHHAQADLNANEMSLPVESNGVRYTLQLRVQDDGVGVRYLLPEGVKHINGESTSWNLVGAVKAGWQGFSACYEANEHWTDFKQVPEKGRIAGLMTVTTKSHYLSLAEADNVNYPDSAFVRNGDTISMQWYAQGQGFAVASPAHLITPWRTTVVTKNLTDLVNSDLLTNLCPPPSKHFDSFSFVKPGRIMWQWCSVGAPKLDDQHDWYDAAARLKWEYYMIDDGWRNWRKDGKDQWQLLKEVIDYGKTKGIETIIWVDSKEMVHSPAARRAYLEKVKSLGAVGIKIDFIPAASANITAWYDETLRDTAELGLMTIFHGSSKPTGRVRTWPHAMTSEAIRGNEWHMTRYNRMAPFDQDVIQPFTRFLIGAGDITPTVLDPVQLRGYTWPHMMAQAITSISPLACFYDHWKFYDQSPAADILREIPVVWDETRVLSCTKIGNTAAFARRKGDTWWVGVVNGPEAAKVEISLDFLKGPAKATLLRDAKEDAALEREETSLKPTDKITLDLRKGGGCLMRLKQGE